MGHVKIHPSVKVHPSAKINVTERLEIGAGGVIGENCEISGRDIVIGQELWMDRGARIGGGSCFERQSSLRAGHFLHMGQDVFINTARPVEIGSEVGLGTRTAIFTHGAYLSALDGFPVSFAGVSIGDNVWIPGAIINPGVSIGHNVVIGVNSLVTKKIPAGALAAGSPAKVIKENAYPAPLVGDSLAAFWVSFFDAFGEHFETAQHHIYYRGVMFDLALKSISGPVTDESERLRNQLRRYGIRFYSRPVNGKYEDWA